MTPTTNTRPHRRHDERAPDAGIARPAGLLVSAVIAAAVFFAGLHFFPLPKREPEPPPSAPSSSVAPPAPNPVTPPPTPPETPPPTPAPQPPVVDAGAADAAIASKGEPANGEPAKGEPEPEADPAVSAAEAGLSPAARKALQADRDLAREAWRRNRPDVSSASNKTSVLIPIKGSVAGASSKVLRKTRTVVVSLPKAISMITMRVYNLKHPVFHRVWIDQDEANARPEDGSKLRFILGETYDPQVEITDDFVRVSVRRVERKDEPTERKRSSKPPAEKSADESDEPAPGVDDD
jgi:hypothetical protein